MSRSEELTRELCPDGVHVRTLDAVITALRTGLNPRQNFKLNAPGATHHYITVRELGGFEIRPTEKTDLVDDEGLSRIQARSKLKIGDVLFSGTGTIGRTALVAEEPTTWNIKEGVYAITPDPAAIDARYLVYVLHSTSVRSKILAAADGSTVASVPMATLRNIRIPVPPLEVQREIVRVLDQFTQLEAELEAELEARKKQYEHYRAQLFAVDEDTSSVPLGELAKNLDSKRKPVTRDARIPGNIPYYGASGVVDYVSEHIFDGDYLLVSEDGANLLARSTPIAFSVTGKTWINNHAHVLEFNTYAERRFVELYLNSIDLSPFISGAAQPKLNKANLNRIPIPHPSFPDKERIVGILDKFDALVNDLSVGLPAELVARRQQYEYYRDMLLTFKELEVTA